MWLAVILMPATHFNSLTAYESSGVGLNDSNTYALMPLAARHNADSSANSGDIWRESNAIATPCAAFPALIM